MAQIAIRTDLSFLNDTSSVPPLARVFVRVAAQMTKWSMLRRTRAELLDLDDHLLSDIGLERPAAFREARRMFWQY